MKDLLEKKIWIITIIVFTIISTLIIVIGIWFNFLVSVSAGILLFLILLGTLMAQAIVTVPERYNYIVTYFGKYYKTLKPGLNLVYPWFNVFNCPISYCVEEHSVDVYENQDDAGNYLPAKMIEFGQSSAWVELEFRAKVVDAELAFTKVEDVYYEIKSIFKKGFIDYVGDKNILKFKDSNEDLTLKTLFPNFDIFKYIEEKWGVEIIDVRFIDVIISEEDRKSRAEVFAEEQRFEVIKIQNKQTVAKAKAEATKIRTLAEANQAAQEFEGIGLKSALERITESNLSPEEASRFLQAIKKWEAVPQVQTGFFSDGQTSAGAGMSKQDIAEIIAISNEIGKK